MSAPTPLLDFFKRGEVARDVRLQAAQGTLAPRAHEQLAILVLLLDDPDAEIRQAADATINRIPVEALKAFLARSDVPTGVREFFAGRGVLSGGGRGDRIGRSADRHVGRHPGGRSGRRRCGDAAGGCRQGISDPAARQDELFPTG